MATEGPVELRSARSLIWARRRATLAAHWRTFRRNRQGMIGLTVLLVFIGFAIVGPMVIDPASVEPATASGPITAPPSLAYPLGTDNFGRSVLSLVIVGARISLLVGFTAAFGTMLIGATVGISAGYFGGTKIDTALNAFTNWFLVLPWIALAIASTPRSTPSRTGSSSCRGSRWRSRSRPSSDPRWSTSSW